jgi:hypothetical protein
MPAGLMFGVLLATIATLPLDAHKPITSPYTFAEDVSPILRDRCAACHVAGGPAPMPLTTVEETVPWGESIRLELVAGHMPPWSAISGGTRLRHAEGLTARELNVLLTWVTGGTPPGDAKPAPPATPSAEWPLGTPDLTLQLPEVSVAADQGEVTRELVVPLDAVARRPLRAVDLRPGTRSLVRSARIAVRPTPHASVENLVGLWVPGDQPVALPPGSAFAVPDNGDLIVTLRLKKTWEHEREAMSDRSTLALYFADSGAVPVSSVETGTAPVAPAPPPGGPVPTGIVAGNISSERIAVRTRVLAVYPTAAAAGATITIDATPDGGLTQRVIEFRPQRGWERRYWLDVPIDLPPGTRLQTSVKFDPFPAQPPSGPLVVLNVVPAPRR